MRNSDDASSTAGHDPKNAHRIHLVTLSSVFTCLAGVLICSTPGTFWNSLAIVAVSCGLARDHAVRGRAGAAGGLVLDEHGLVGEELLELVVRVLVIEEPEALHSLARDLRVGSSCVSDRVDLRAGSPSPA